MQTRAALVAASHAHAVCCDSLNVTDCDSLSMTRGILGTGLSAVVRTVRNCNIRPLPRFFKNPASKQLAA
jgi:hypothetical protein